MKKIKINYMLILTILTLLFASIVFYQNSKKGNKDLTFAYILANTGWEKMSKIENEYTCRMYDIIDRFSSRSTRNSMSKEIRIKYTSKNFTLANVFGMGYFDVPIIHILETALNPYASHDLYNEVGMGGFWFSTAKYYYYVAKQTMSKRLFKHVNFDLKNPIDLTDPINALKMTYIFLWIERNNYDGAEMWYISGYRWGRFVGKHWEDGLNEYPVKFVIYTKYGKKQYNPRAYFWTWNNMRNAFESGKLEVGVQEFREYDKKKDARKIEEIEYRRLYRVMKQQEKELNDIKAFLSIVSKKVEKYEKLDKKEIKVIKQIGSEAKAKGWGGDLFEKFKRKIRGFAK